jgi:gluconate 2-dehydrogenase gamma chain
MTDDTQRGGRGLSRRQLLIGGASAGGAIAAGGALATIATGAGTATAAPANHLQVLSPAQAELFAAMADRIYPADGDGWSASRLGFTAYFDGQLASSWGSGDGLYQHGPTHDPTSSGHGYQLTKVPKELYPLVADKIAAYVQGKYGKPFTQLSPDDQDAVMTALQAGKVDLDLASTEYGYTSAYFFGLFQGFVEQAVFADPMYGGNHDMNGWRWIGYPGDPMGYGDAYWTIFPHQDDAYNVEPRSISQDTMGGMQGISGANDMPGMEMGN